jgi:hypothetical protein
VSVAFANETAGDGGGVVMQAAFATRNASPDRELEPTVIAKARGYNSAKSEGAVLIFSDSDSGNIIR